MTFTVFCWIDDIHLVIEDFGFTSLGLWDESLIQDVEDILADLFEFGPERSARSPLLPPTMLTRYDSCLPLARVDADSTD